ncbi:hypothetical protein BH20ACI2_BH20ACI2_09410 [soil metagenome]
MRRKYLKRLAFGVFAAVFLLTLWGAVIEPRLVDVNLLYVNRGIGFSSFPVRINCRPELTIFSLRSGNN